MTRLNFFTLSLFLLFISFKSIAQDSLHIVGQWGPKIEFDLVPVAVANLPDGRLLTWSSKYHDDFGGDDGFTFTQIFDPTILDSLTGHYGGVLPRTVTDTNHDMFCPGINNLADGRILVSGGSSDEKSSIYDPRTEQWTAADNLNIPRGYQGAVTLSDGSAFTIGGSWSGGPYGGRDAEIWKKEASGEWKWTELSGLKGELLYNQNDLDGDAEGVYRVDNHAWLWAAPNGKIFHAGPGEEMHWFDVTGDGSYTSAGPNGKRDDDHMSMNGNTVMFDIGKILKVGGSASYSSGTVSNENAYVIDINDENNVTVTRTANDMAHARIYVNSVVLPNGEVLVLGGMQTAVVFSDTGAHLSAEMYNPETNSFRTLASMQVPRTYHSAGILLPDGRVFMGGGGLCGENCAANHKDAEIFSPPYLFDASGNLAVRPTVNAPDKAFYGKDLPVTASSDVTEFSFIRLSSATHSINNEQRRVPVTFTTSGNYHLLDMPDANIMPPGYYMLFGLNDAGVPSISETVLVGLDGSKIQEDNLLVEFDFFEGSGDLVMDTSGNENHGTIKERDDDGNPIALRGEYWSANGLSGNALEMDGMEHQSNSILEIPPSQELQALTDQITVMAWVNRDPSDNPPNVAIFNHHYTSSASGSFFFGYHGSQYKFEFFTSTNGHADIYHEEQRYTPGVWEHLVGTYDGTTAILYVNGEELERVTTSGDLKINTNDTIFNTFTLSGFYETRPMPIDGGNSSGITDELDGRMDKFKLYNTALTAAEIKSIYDDELDVIIVDGPCDAIALEYELNGIRDGRRKEITVREGDTVGFFLDDVEIIDYTVIDPDGIELVSHVVDSITKYGDYTVNYTLKKYAIAQNIVVDSVSSEQAEGMTQPAQGYKAVDRDSKTFWQTRWGGSTPIPTHPHFIIIDLGVVSTISGIEYLPRQDENINGTITEYEIFVSDDPTVWDTQPDAEGTWVYSRDLKFANFPEKAGRYVRLRALKAGTGDNQDGASAAEIRIVTVEDILCSKTLKINVEKPETYTYDGVVWSPSNPIGVSGQFDDLIIESGNAVISENTLSQTVTVNPGAALTINNTSVILTIKNALILNSTSTSYASLIDKGWLTGVVNYNRFVNKIGTGTTGGNDLISSPITGVVFDADFVADNPQLAEHPNKNGIYGFGIYNVANGKYENFNLGEERSGSIPLEPGFGYRAATEGSAPGFNGSTLSFKGQTTRNQVDVFISDAAAGNAWNLIGNPYPSYLDAEEFLDLNKEQFDSRGAYQAIYGYTGISNGWTIWNQAAIDDPNITTAIAPGQGFFVKAKSGGGTVSFTPEMRITGTTDDFIKGRPNKNVALSKLKLGNASQNEVTTSVYFIDGTTKGLDPGYDAAAYSATELGLSLFTNLLEDHTGLDIAIQSLPYNEFNDVVVPLGIKAKAGEELTISIDELSTLPSNINVYLEDIQNKTLTLLNADAFLFTPTIDMNGAGRFNLHYSARTLSIADMPSNDNLRIYTTVVPKALVISGQLTSATTASLYDIQGRLVLSKLLNPNITENTMDISTISAGIYVVKFNNDNQVKTQKLIIK